MCSEMLIIILTYLYSPVIIVILNNCHCLSHNQTADMRCQNISFVLLATCTTHINLEKTFNLYTYTVVKPYKLQIKDTVRT